MKSPYPKDHLSHQLFRAIEESEVSRYRIAKETGISQSALSLFCNNKRGLSLDAIDALLKFFDLEVKPRNQRRK